MSLLTSALLATESIDVYEAQIANAENYGSMVALIGIALCVILCGVGSAIGLYKTGTAAAGVLGENPKLFGKVLVLVLLPATQGIYGFIIGILASSSISSISAMVVAGEVAGALAEGWRLFFAVMPMAIAGLVTGILQGRSAVNCIYAVGKQESLGGKLIIYPAMIEFYAILGLIISIMLI